MAAFSSRERQSKGSGYSLVRPVRALVGGSSNELAQLNERFRLRLQVSDTRSVDYLWPAKSQRTPPRRRDRSKAIRGTVLPGNGPSWILPPEARVVLVHRQNVQSMVPHIAVYCVASSIKRIWCQTGTRCQMYRVAIVSARPGT
eukprot:3333036-Prymnesium_polylepis.1